MTLDPTDARVVQALVDEALTRMDHGDLDAAARLLEEAEQVAPDAAAVASVAGRLAWARGDDEAARQRLAHAVALHPEDAEAHYTLARIHEDHDEHGAMVEHDLVVLRLDAAEDRRLGTGTPADLDFIAELAEGVLEGLPEGLAERVEDVPIVLEARPSAGLVREGFDPRALGLFEGAEQGSRSDAIDLRPTRIVLFYANLLATCDDDEELREQVEITILHEIGHFFGLDEDDVDALGLG